MTVVLELGNPGNALSRNQSENPGLHNSKNFYTCHLQKCTRKTVYNGLICPNAAAFINYKAIVTSFENGISTIRFRDIIQIFSSATFLVRNSPAYLLSVYVISKKKT